MVASIPSPPANGFHLGPVDLHIYGLMYVVAVVAAIAITIRRWEAVGGSRRLVYEVAAWGFPAGIIGGRIYFDLTSANLVPDHWFGPIAIWDGGLGIWGGIAAGTVAGLLVLRRRRADIPRFLDAAAPALLVAQAIGRLGNYFNQELFGGPTNLPWGLEISPAHRPPGYETFATFQPTFLYELIWNLGLAGFLVWLGHHRRIRAPGLFALYVTGYSGFRIFEELLRVDPAHHLLGFRLNFWVACALTIAGAAWFVAIQRRRGAPARPHRARRWALFALGWATVAAVGCGTSNERSLQTSRPQYLAGATRDLGRWGRGLGEWSRDLRHRCAGRARSRSDSESERGDGTAGNGRCRPPPLPRGVPRRDDRIVSDSEPPHPFGVSSA